MELSVFVLLTIILLICPHLRPPRNCIMSAVMQQHLEGLYRVCGTLTAMDSPHSMTRVAVHTQTVYDSCSNVSISLLSGSPRTCSSDNTWSSSLLTMLSKSEQDRFKYSSDIETLWKYCWMYFSASVTRGGHPSVSAKDRIPSTLLGWNLGRSNSSFIFILMFVVNYLP